MTKAVAFLALLALAGCAKATKDLRIMWDAKGCAYSIEHEMSAIWRVYPLPDADRDTCKVSP